MLSGNPKHSINHLHNLIHDEIQLVDQLIEENLQSEISLISQIGDHITNSGGKKFRPMLLLLITQYFSYHGNQHINLAAIIEFIHTATLLHDDVVDGSLLRRGQKTANQLWGNEASVLVGDFLYSRAFQMMVKTNSIPIMRVLSETTNTIAEGEVQQLLHKHNPNITETDYISVIRKKTAKLFEATGKIGTILSQRSALDEKKMAQYGLHLGTVFQLIDDVLDYDTHNSELNKNIGDDLAEGKPTLPLLYAMWTSKQKESDIIRQAIVDGGIENIETIRTIIKQAGAINYTLELAQKEAKLARHALSTFTNNQYLEEMYNLIEFAIVRRS